MALDASLLFVLGSSAGGFQFLRERVWGLRVGEEF